MIKVLSMFIFLVFSVIPCTAEILNTAAIAHANESQVSDSTTPIYPKEIIDSKTFSENLKAQQKQTVQNPDKSAEKLAEDAAKRIGLCLFLISLPLIAWAIAIIDILRNDFTGSNKIRWILGVSLVPVIGPILYYFLGERHKISPQISPPED